MSLIVRPTFPSAFNLIGNVDVPRDTLPIVRSGKRRHDPDGTSASPYYLGATGKTLRVAYTIVSGPSIVETSSDIALTGDSYTVILSNLNTFFTTSSILLQALDLDGFIAIRNLNPGAVHYVRISPFSTPSSDAAPILGFAVFPLPGSTGYAGDISFAPGSKLQSNPPTTTLLSKDDTLSSSEFNRGLVSILQMVEGLRAELNRDVIVHKDVSLNFSVVGGKNCAQINDDTLRVFVPAYLTADLPVQISTLTPYFRILDGSSEQAVQDPTPVTGDPRVIEVNGLFYGTTSTTFDDENTFVTWGTPNGGTIIGDTVKNKDKQPSTAITSIVGNIIQCSGAAFVTNKIKAGDPVEINSNVVQPFDHSGWFAVDAVIDETHVAIRSMAISEDLPSSKAKPTWLNPAALPGTLRVAVGRFIPAGNVFISTTRNSSSLASFTVRLPVGVPYVQTLTDDRALHFAGNLNALANALHDHISASANAHASSAISSLAISIAGSAPNSIASGTVLTQLTALLTALQTHVNQTTGSHAATSISYAGGGNWADATTNPATTVEGQLDKIISDLSPSTGSAKIGGAASGTDIAAGTLATQIADLAVNWLKKNRADVISAAQTFSSLITASAGIAFTKPGGGSAVTVVSPSALAGSYGISWPSSLPSAVTPLSIDSSGNLSSTQTIVFPATLAYPLNPSSIIFSPFPPTWDIGNSGILECPIIVPVGSKIISITVIGIKGSSSSSTIEVQTGDYNGVTGIFSNAFLVNNSVNNPGAVLMTASTSITVTANHLYTLSVREANTVPGTGKDFIRGWSVTLG